MSGAHEFGKLRAFLWPIHRHELPKFVPMLVIFFLICFNYNLLRTTKDALVITAPLSGAEAIPFIKVWAILPSALLMTWIYTRLSNWLKREYVFYTLLSLFLIFFSFFVFVLYPYRDSLHCNDFADRLEFWLPKGCHGLIAMVRNWTFTLYYIMSEMWSTIIMTVLFWGFANDVTSIKDAKRFYIFLGVFANIAGILSGWTATALSYRSFQAALPLGTNAWEQTVSLSCCIVILNCLICMLLFRYLHKKPHVLLPVDLVTSKAENPRMGLRKSFGYLAKSPYLLCIAVIVIAYNLSLNLVEVVWKDQVKNLFPNPADFNAYMGRVLTFVSIIAIPIALFVSGNIFRYFSWTLGAMLTPLIMGVTGLLFFIFTVFQKNFLGLSGLIAGFSPLMLAVFFGSLQNCLARASKYTLFDSTKEMAFIPLSRASRLQGKAAIDGVGSRIGKSGGSFIHQILLVTFGTIASSAPYIAIILIGSIGIWILAVQFLGKKFQVLEQNTEGQIS